MKEGNSHERRGGPRTGTWGTSGRLARGVCSAAGTPCRTSGRTPSSEGRRGSAGISGSPAPPPLRSRGLAQPPRTPPARTTMRSPAPSPPQLAARAHRQCHQPHVPRHWQPEAGRLATAPPSCHGTALAIDICWRSSTGVTACCATVKSFRAGFALPDGYGTESVCRNESTGTCRSKGRRACAPGEAREPHDSYGKTRKSAGNLQLIG